MTNTFSTLMVQALTLGALMAVVHATFQLGISVLTLLSGHSLIRRRSQQRLLGLTFAYTLGSVIMTALVMIGLVYMFDTFSVAATWLNWLVLAVVAGVVAIAIMLAYYRRGKGTLLWIPRSFADYLESRAGKTKHTVEAAALGGMTFIAELPFSLILMCIAARAIALLAPANQILAVTAYVLIASLPLIVVTCLIGSGHRLSQIQRWREANKSFLQYSAGIALLAGTLYIVTFFISEAVQ